MIPCHYYCGGAEYVDSWACSIQSLGDDSRLVFDYRATGYAEPLHQDYLSTPGPERCAWRPPDLQSHLTVLVGDRLALEGHIPEGVIVDVLAVPADAIERLLVYQDNTCGTSPFRCKILRQILPTNLLNSDSLDLTQHLVPTRQDTALKAILHPYASALRYQPGQACSKPTHTSNSRQLAPEQLGVLPRLSLELRGKDGYNDR